MCKLEGNCEWGRIVEPDRAKDLLRRGAEETLRGEAQRQHDQLVTLTLCAEHAKALGRPS